MKARLSMPVLCLPLSNTTNPTRTKPSRKATEKSCGKTNLIKNHKRIQMHAKVDAKSKLVDKQVCTPASVHDSQVLDDLLDEEDQGQDLYADSGYVGKQDEEAIKNHKMGNKVCERAYRNKPLNEEQKKTNRKKSHIRCRVEQVFGFMEQSMYKLAIRSIGLLRAKFASGFTALLYNMTRYEQIVRLGMN